MSKLSLTYEEYSPLCEYISKLKGTEGNLIICWNSYVLKALIVMWNLRVEEQEKIICTNICLSLLTVQLKTLLEAQLLY